MTHLLGELDSGLLGFHNPRGPFIDRRLVDVGVVVGRLWLGSPSMALGIVWSSSESINEFFAIYTRYDMKSEDAKGSKKAKIS